MRSYLISVAIADEVIQYQSREIAYPMARLGFRNGIAAA